MIRLARVLSAVGSAIRLFSFAFLIPVPVAILFEPGTVPLLAGIAVPATVAAFLSAFLLATAVWVPLRLATRNAQTEDLLDREGYLAVGLGWLAVAGLGGVPFALSGVLRGPVDSFTESMAGLTGTASSSLHDLGTLPASIVFWRILLSWLGGLAIIVLMVALLSRLTHGGMPARQGAGVAGGARLRPKLAEAARSLWILYAVVSVCIAAVLAVLLYLRAGLGVQQAWLQGVLQGFGAYSTGGISDPAGPWPGAGDWAIDLVMVVAMLAGGTNFALTFSLLRRGAGKSLWRDHEWRFYLIAFAGSAIAVIALLVRDGHGLAEAFHHGAYTVASLYTGTGTWISDYAAWPAAALMVLLLLMVLGGSSGSTAGGVKAFRWLVLGKLVMRELRKLLHPRAVVPVRVGSAVVKEETLSAIMAFFFTYLLLWTAGAVLLLAIEPNLDASDSAAAAASALGNVGAGFGYLGPTHGFAALLPASKLVLAALMWLGRLEIFTALVLLHPLSWRT